MGWGGVRDVLAEMLEAVLWIEGYGEGAGRADGARRVRGGVGVVGRWGVRVITLRVGS
jgi:hypothetical protein